MTIANKRYEGISLDNDSAYLTHYFNSALLEVELPFMVQVEELIVFIHKS